MVRSKGEPTLKFREGPIEGCMGAGMAEYADVDCTRIVRELIQNSLDDVRSTGRDKTIVRFELAKI